MLNRSEAEWKAMEMKEVYPYLTYELFTDEGDENNQTNLTVEIKKRITDQKDKTMIEQIASGVLDKEYRATWDSVAEADKPRYLFYGKDSLKKRGESVLLSFFFKLKWG